MKPIIVCPGFKILLMFLLLITFSLTTSAQMKNKTKEKTLFGIGSFYDFQTKGVALDLRARIPVYTNTYVVPRLSFFPGFNNVDEYYLGADANYQVYQYKKIKPYALVGGFYDNWINAADFTSKKAKKNNFVFEAGTGVLFDLGCLNPFIEYRYDTKWLEGSLGLGVYFRFCKCFSHKKKIKCPAYS